MNPQGSSDTVRLTQTVQKGGCAAKVAAHELRALLNQVKFPPKDPRVRVDGGTFDDAAIFEINDDLALVQTLDFFTPIVDSPRTFGRVAAANALSDVYAMGGEPETALAILAYPIAQFDSALVAQVLQGACDVMTEARVSLVGGHSIDDDTMKFGLSVTGRVHPKKVWSNAGAQAGDALILTKAIGTGTMTAGLKKSTWTENEMSDAIESMALLNRTQDLLEPTDLEAIHAATDVTGFGLAGHGVQLARASGKCLRISFKKLPIFERAFESLKMGHLTKAHRTNAEYTKTELHVESGVEPGNGQILFDPQTSGGLLLSVSPSQAESIVSKLQTRFGRACVIGYVDQAKDDKRMIVEP